MQNNKEKEPEHLRDFEGTEAIEKLKAIAEAARTCMFTTFTTDSSLPSRPMAVQQVDEDGNIYFFSSASSDKNRELKEDPSVQLFFCNSGKSEYLSVYGTATISKDSAKIKELWNAFAKVWFQEGPEDPELTLITIHPEDCRYWDTQHNKTVQWLKIAASVVTGKTMDDGVAGKLTV